MVLESWLLRFFDVADVFLIKLTIFLLTLVMIGQMVKKWQPFFDIQDGGDRHLEFLQICISDDIDIFQIEGPMFSQILVTISQIIEKWQQFFEIQDGGRRHLELWLRRFFDFIARM